jgi:hypothetical protein
VSPTILGFDAFTVAGIVWAALAGAALKSIWHRAGHSRKVKVIWTVLAIAVPFVGALGWFALGRERRR